MGLSASMWTSVSGLISHGNKMNVVGNNIANVSTIGFKGQRMDFNDYLYLNGGSTSGPTQIGAGVSTYAVLGDFSQGSLESTNSGTDLAIDGEGWFKVRKPNTEQMYYTRAGDFYFNSDRQLQNPEGLRLQGWKIDTDNRRLTFKQASINLGENISNESAFQGTGTPKDIVLDSWYIKPKRTDSIRFTMGLTSDNENDRATGDKNNGPFLGLVNQWNGLAAPESPMPDKQYATQSSIKVYDESGIAHELTVYYDQVAATKSVGIDNLPTGYSMYEYVVTMPPAQDLRVDATGKPFSETRAAGLLMTGHMVFDASGNLMTQSAYTYQGVKTPGGSASDYNNNNLSVVSGTGLNYAAWKPTQLSSNGLPVFTANFKGMKYASEVDMIDKSSGEAFASQEDQLIELDLGVRFSDNFPSKIGTNDLSLASLVPDKTNTEPISPLTPANGTGKFYWDATLNSNAGGWTSTIPTDADPALVHELVLAANGTPAKSGNDYIKVGTNEKYDKGEWTAATKTWTSTSLTDADKKTNTFLQQPLVDYNKLALGREDARFYSDNPTKSGGKSFVTQDAKANGYTSGVLSSTTITNDGVVYGYYDNGESLPLYQIALYDFHNEQGLRREGGNLYGATKESGDPRQGVAGDNGFGAIRSYNIEGSNVDMSREFVNMITTQRGFQANSKGITTVDTMLETVIGMKR